MPNAYDADANDADANDADANDTDANDADANDANSFLFELLKVYLRLKKSILGQSPFVSLLQGLQLSLLELRIAEKADR
jgi:hypothetical protein